MTKAANHIRTAPKRLNAMVPFAGTGCRAVNLAAPRRTVDDTALPRTTAQDDAAQGRTMPHTATPGRTVPHVVAQFNLCAHPIQRSTVQHQSAAGEPAWP